jgi:hypothetical protein
MEVFKKYTQNSGSSISIKGDDKDDFIVIEVTNEKNSVSIKINAHIAFSLADEIRSISNRANMYGAQQCARVVDYPS